MQTEKQIINNTQKIIAKMVHAFIIQASHQPPEKVIEIYKSFEKDWHNRVRKINAKVGSNLISYDVWDTEWRVNGYLKYITIPIPKQLPDEERAKLLIMKKELIRLVFIVEGKTDHQRQRRELKYKTLFVIMRFKKTISNLFKKK